MQMLSVELPKESIERLDRIIEAENRFNPVNKWTRSEFIDYLIRQYEKDTK